MTRTDDRRRADRCAVDFFVQEQRGDRTFLHPAINLSANGIYVLVSDDRRALDPEQTLNLEFTLPTGAPVRTTGHVAYIDDRQGQRGLGVTFEGLQDEERDAIQRFVAATIAAQQRIRRSA